MRLSRIKLAGFKSFVDPTTIEFDKDRVAVVGPNGCGKSNVIDAVRWVMGESSAKHLRGESITDVIFNGSGGRKPVGQASVELVFDNTDGTLGGEYSAYTEISIKRVVNREAESQYYLNGVRCRRRDITHIFLGTGLGARSYSIIEQGTISRLIEAKPEELRNFLEETAGISKYKERRRETENRMKHTRENVERLNDVRDELERQQEKLKRQSESAAKFKIFREEEDLFQAQCWGIQWRDLDIKFNEESAALGVAQAHAEGIAAERTRLETQWEQLRIEHDALSDALSQAQNRFYEVGSQASRIEQDLKHAKHRLASLTEEHTNTLQSLGELREEQSQDEIHMVGLTERIQTVEPLVPTTAQAYEQAAQQLSQAETALQQWQKAWDTLNHAFHEVSQKAHGEQTTITHLEQATYKAQERLERLKTQAAALESSVIEGQMAQAKTRADNMQAQVDACKVTLEEARGRIQAARDDITAAQDALDDHKEEIQSTKADLTKQVALQEAALKGVHQSTNDWLKAKGFNDAKRLAQCLRVEPGFEQAIETVLGDTLQAVCVADLYTVRDGLSDFPAGECCFLTQGHVPATRPDTLLSKLQESPFDLSPWLGNVLVVEDDAAAWDMQPRLAEHESVISKTGLWLSQSWLRVSKKVTDSSSVLAREKRIQALTAALASLEEEVPVLTEALSRAKDALMDREMDRDDAQKAANEAHRLLVEARSHFTSLQKEATQIADRRKQVEHELADVTRQLAQDEARVKTTRASLAEHLDKMGAFEQEKIAQAAAKEQIVQSHLAAKLGSKESFDEMQRIKIEWNTLQSSLQGALKNKDRLTLQLDKMSQHAERLHTDIEETGKPIPALESEFASLLSQRAEADNGLQAARAAVDSGAHAMRDCEQKRHGLEEALQTAREKLEGMRLNMQTLKVRAQTVEEQLAATPFVLTEIVQGLPHDATAAAYEQSLTTVRDRIKRLGAINLAAIEEYEATHERRSYLDAQLQDLTTALEALESAIAKIDKETRDRFKETFDKVNENLRTLFPQVFNGGEAYLEMTGDNLLETGVSIMARPPGKRNATIHLLSGGEKALTAMALVFSLFRLNPSPFCMLDEVDAPLDDTNVGRFCNLVKEMAKSVQFIFITHNKLTMEMGETMMGVTMKEPGVSRIVSVNIDEAVALAEA
ncbi:MAG: chromosome segregation protein SMC [Gammaproteobacteria bacterium]